MAYDGTYLVRRTRELAQQFGSALQFRDGFTGEAITDAAATPILPAINEYIAKIAITGFYKKYFTQNTVDNQSVYAIDADCVDVISVYLGGKPLRRTTRDEQNTDYPGWFSLAKGTPTRYIAEGSSLILIPAPIGVAPINVWGKALPPALTAGGSTITGMGNAQAIRVPYGAALTIATIDDKNAAHAERRKLYAAEAELLIQELSSIQDKQDDYGPLSLDNWIPVPVVSSGMDGS